MSQKQITVLISSAGQRVDLMRCFREDAARLGVDLRIIATDMQPSWSAACHTADVSFPMPRCTTPEFLDETLSLCVREGVDLVVPTLDTELLPFSRAHQEFAAHNVRLAVSGSGTVELARDKLKTAQILDAHGIATPNSATVEEVLSAPDAWPGPLLLKPRDGSRSVGIRSIASIADLPDPDVLEGYVIQELLEGPEYTVNMFFDHVGSLRAAVPHRRHEVRAGEVSKGVAERHEALEIMAEQLGQVLEKPFGALCFQAIVTAEQQPKIIEINARFGGGFPLAHHAGARFPQWLIEIVSGRPCSAANDWRDGVVMLRYFAGVFTER